MLNRWLKGACILAILMHSAPALAGTSVPTFSKTFGPDTMGPGSISVLNFVIDNSASGSAVTDLAFADPLPAGVTIASVPNAITTCLEAVLLAPAGGSTITFSDGEIGAASTCTVQVNVTSSTAGTHTNTSRDLTSSAGNSGTATDDLAVSAALPGFSKSFSPSSIAYGGRSTLTFTIDNSASELSVFYPVFTDQLPSGMLVASPSNAVTSCPGTITAIPGSGTISLARGFTLSGQAPISGGTTCTVSVDVKAFKSGTLSNISGELTTYDNAFLQGSANSSGMAADDLVVSVTDLLLIKDFTNDPVNPGGTVTLEFTITNFDRAFAATAITFTDDLDATLSGLVATGLPSNDVCGAGSTLSGTSVLTLAGASLGPEASCTFSVKLQVPASATAGEYPNTTSAISAMIDGSTETGNAASETLNINNAPTLTKTFLDDPVGAGGTTTVEFTITNTSAVFGAIDIEFQDNLAAFMSGVTVAALPANGSCGATSMFSTPEIGAELQFSMTGGSLDASASCTFSMDLLVPIGTKSGLYTNTTDPISAVVGEESATGLTASAMLQVNRGPRLRKTFTDSPVAPGDTVTLEFELTHEPDASLDATAISFTDDLSATLSGMEATGLPIMNVCGTGSKIDGTTNLSFTGGTLAPDEVCTFSVTLQVPAASIPGTYTNTTSSVTATVGTVKTISEPGTADLSVTGLMVTKTFPGDPVLPGATISLQFQIDNSGAADASAIIFTDSLSATLSGLTTVGAPPTDPCGAGSSISGTTFLIFTGGSVPAGETCRFEVTLQVPAGAADGIYNNVTSVPQALWDGNTILLDPATDRLTVDSDLLFLSKSFPDDPAMPGGTVTLEFTLTNQSATDTVTDIEFTDDLDAALPGLVATGLPVKDVCGAGSLLEGTKLITLTGGKLTAGTSCTFSVTLSVPVGIGADTVVLNTTSSVSGKVGASSVTGGPASDGLMINFVNFSKAFNLPSVAGGTVDLSFTLQNLSATNAVNALSFTDDLNAVMTGLVASVLPADGFCGGSSSITGASLLTVTGVDLVPGGSCTIVVTVQVPVAATVGTFPNSTSDLFQGGLIVAGAATADLMIEPPENVFSDGFEDP